MCGLKGGVNNISFAGLRWFVLAFHSCTRMSDRRRVSDRHRSPSDDNTSNKEVSSGQKT